MNRFLSSLLCLLIAVPLARAQIEETIVVDLVDLYLTATDEKGHFITDLKQDELTVTEDGVAQKIERFGAFAGERNEIPLVLALVIDNSASMDGEIEQMRKLDLARDAGLSMLKELGPLDRVKLVQFSDTVTATELTSDKQIIRNELNKMRPRWWHTAMFDAVASTTKELATQPGRKILLLCSDGQDNMSKTNLEEVIKIASGTPELTVIVLGTVGQSSRFWACAEKCRACLHRRCFMGKRFYSLSRRKRQDMLSFRKTRKSPKKCLNCFEILCGASIILLTVQRIRSWTGPFARFNSRPKEKE